MRVYVLFVVLAAGCGSPLASFAPDAAAPVTTSDGGAPDRMDGGSEALPDAGDAAPDAGVVEVPDAGIADPPDAGELPYPWTIGPTQVPATEWFANPPACAPNDWLAKYFEYRRRLRGDGTGAYPGFVSIGLGPGQSLPAGMRTPSTDCANDWMTTDCRVSPIPANSRGKYLWGDGTIWLGWYMRTLASEHAAFRKLGLDTAETERDLHHALAAFDRLDAVAETYFGVAPALDGFFIRDDVQGGFVWADANHTVPRFPRNDGFSGYSCIVSGTNCGTVSTENGNFISQDQFIEMLPGLAMIALLVPPDVEVDGMNLSQHAKEIVHRVTKHLRDHSWKIVDPQGNSPPNQWGGTALPYSNQIAKCANFVTGNAFGISDYRDALSQTAGASLTGAVDAAWFAETLNNQAMVLSLESVSDEWSEDKLVGRSADWDSPVYPMIANVLHGRGLPAGVGADRIESMLTSAPCTGPCHNAAGCAEVPGWQGEHRFKSPEDRDGDVYGYDGEYPGLDYMLLHNLYVLLKDGRYEPEWQPPPRCAGPTTLDDLLQNGASGTDSYDPWNACNRRDFGRNFCGRTFAGWLDAAYRGEASIFVAGGRLSCTGHAPCAIVPASGTGTDGEDLFLGSAGDDTFEGGAGFDCLYGFGGRDTLKGGRGNDEIHGGDGNDLLCGEGCNLTEIDGEPDELWGEDGDDELQGGPASDQLQGGPGRDTLNGGPGYDHLNGGDGDDDCDGDLGDDLIHGGPGNDVLHGGFGADVLYGEDGNDTLYGNAGDDRLKGGPGRDKLNGGDGDDSLAGGPGDDILFGDNGKDDLDGEDGADRLCGGCEEDKLFGGWDSDVDQCRGEAATLCFTNTSNTLQNCEASASSSECRDAAFDSW